MRYLKVFHPGDSKPALQRLDGRSEEEVVKMVRAMWELGLWAVVQEGVPPDMRKEEER